MTDMDVRDPNASAESIPSDEDRLAMDIGNWVDAETARDGVPDFWDEMSTSERLAAYLVSLGYRK